MSIVDGVNVVSAVAVESNTIFDKLNVLSLLKKTPDAEAALAAAAPAEPTARGIPAGPVPRGGDPGGGGGRGGDGGGGGAAAPPEGGGKRGPPDFSDLRLPPDIAAVVKSPLEDFQMRLDEETKSSELLDKCTVNLAVNGTWSAYLLHIEKTYLEDARYAPDVANLTFLFSTGDRIRVFSRNCSGPVRSIAANWLDLRKRFNLFFEYVEWRDVRDLVDVSAIPDKAAKQLQIALKLPDEIERKGTKRPPGNLLSAKADLDMLIATIKWYAEINYPTMLALAADMLTKAGLDAVRDKLAGRTWDTFEIEIPKFVVYLHKLGIQDGKPGYWFLASFLLVLMEDGAVEPERRRKCLELVARYQLIPALELEQLKKKLFPLTNA